MPRKSTDTAQLKLRIREDLRRQLEAAAKKRDVSLNYEMTDRLRASFDRADLYTLGRVASDMQTVWARYGEAIHRRVMQEELMQAIEALIEQLPTEVRERKSIKTAVTQVQKTIRTIEAEVGRMGDDQ